MRPFVLVALAAVAGLGCASAAQTTTELELVYSPGPCDAAFNEDNPPAVGSTMQRRPVGVGARFAISARERQHRSGGRLMDGAGEQDTPWEPVRVDVEVTPNLEHCNAEPLEFSFLEAGRGELSANYGEISAMLVLTAIAPARIAVTREGVPIDSIDAAPNQDVEISTFVVDAKGDVLAGTWNYHVSTDAPEVAKPTTFGCDVEVIAGKPGTTTLTIATAGLTATAPITVAE